MQLFYHSSYSQLPLPPHHRFPIEKYALLYQQLMSHPTFAPRVKVCCAPVAQYDQLASAHQVDYINAILQNTLPAAQQKRIGFTLNKALQQRTLHSVGNSIGAAFSALEYGFALNLSGGYHHAFSDHGSGFCVFNDLAIAAKLLIQQQRVNCVLLLDLDVHQGDGSAHILSDDSQIITCSLHAEQNFPRIKQHSDHDFSLPNHCDDTHYLDTLHHALQLVTHLHKPDIILYNAGADVHQNDELGQLDLSLAGVRQRDTLVMAHCQTHNIPLCAVLGGGYQRNVNALVQVHWQLIESYFALESTWLSRYKENHKRS